MAQIADFINRAIPSGQQQEIGIGNFTAFVTVRSSFKLQADVPATPVEDGSVIHDHIVLKSLVLTIEGDVSDVHVRRQPLPQILTRAQAEIGNLSNIYATAKTLSQTQKASEIANSALDAIAGLDTRVLNGEQVLALFGNKDAGSKTNQELFLDAMEALYNGRQIISIDMPFRRRDNMVITSFTSNTDNQTDRTVFSIEAQQVKFVETQFVEVKRAASGTGGQLSGVVSKGKQEGTAVERSLLANIFE